MLNIEDKNIQITRGDMLPITVSAINGTNNENYEFQTGDILRFKVTQANKVEKVMLQKDFTVEENTTEELIMMTSQEMKIGELKSKPVDYWYEIELNPDTDKTMTIVGYTKEEGPAILTLLPEGGDETDD